MADVRGVTEEYISTVRDVQFIRYFSRESSSNCCCAAHYFISYCCSVVALIILAYDICELLQFMF